MNLAAYTSGELEQLARDTAAWHLGRPGVPVDAALIRELHVTLARDGRTFADLWSGYLGEPARLAAVTQALTVLGTLRDDVATALEGTSADATRALLTVGAHLPVGELGAAEQALAALLGRLRRSRRATTRLAGAVAALG